MQGIHKLQVYVVMIPSILSQRDPWPFIWYTEERELKHFENCWTDGHGDTKGPFLELGEGYSVVQCILQRISVGSG